MSIASGYGPNWTTAEGRAVELQRRVVELEQQLAAVQTDAENWSALYENMRLEADWLRDELARVKTLSATWREQAQALAEQQEAECDPDIASVLEATGDQLETCAEELDAALSPAPEPILSTCPVCGDPDDHEHDSMAAPAPELPLMARREWMGDGTDYFVVHGDFCLEVESFRGKAPYYEADGSLIVIGDSAVCDQVDAEVQPDGIYRIADTDEHGLPVVERTADMPEDVTHMTLHTRRFFRAGELRARSVEGDEGLLRIEDYRPAAQESGDASD